VVFNHLKGVPTGSHTRLNILSISDLGGEFYVGLLDRVKRFHLQQPFRGLNVLEGSPERSGNCRAPRSLSEKVIVRINLLCAKR
jgi:hypothetical protein